MTFADFLRLVRAEVTPAGICYAIDEALLHMRLRNGSDQPCLPYARRLQDHIMAMLTQLGDEHAYLCTCAANLLGREHPAFGPLTYGARHPFGQYFRQRWLDRAIGNAEADLPLPSFFTKEELEDLWDEFIKEQ